MFSALNYCCGIFFKSLSYLYEVVHLTFCWFWDFSQLLTTIWWKLWRHLVIEIGTLKCIWKSNPFWRKVNTESKSTHKPQLNTCSNNVPLERTARLQTGAWQREKQTNLYHIFTPIAGMCIFPKICMVIEDEESIKNGPSFFYPMHSFSYRGHGKSRSIWLMHGLLQ